MLLNFHQSRGISSGLLREAAADAGCATSSSDISSGFDEARDASVEYMDEEVEAAADEMSAENEKDCAEVDAVAAGARRAPSNAAVNTSGSCSSSRIAKVCGLILKSDEAEKQFGGHKNEGIQYGR